MFMTDTLTSFLYHVTVGRGNPLAEQLTRSDSRILGTETEGDGLDKKTGRTKKVTLLAILVSCIKTGLSVDIRPVK